MTETLFTQLASQGVLGVIASIFGVCFWYITKRFIDYLEKINDIHMQQIRESNEVISKMSDNVAKTNSILIQIKEDFNKMEQRMERMELEAARK